MRVRAQDVVTPLVVGIVDQLAENFDENRGNTAGFDGIQGWGRVGVTALAYVGQMMNMQAELCRTVAIAATPLATKSIVRNIMTWAGMARPVARRTTRSAPSPAKVAWRPQAVGY